MPSNYLWLLDPGHGGVIDGEYQTIGKRSPKFEDGTQLYEGEFNRAIVQRLLKLCVAADISCINLVEGYYDLPLRERVRIANNIHAKRKAGKVMPKQSCIYVSVHSNAHTPTHALEFNGAHGWEVFTSKGQTKSDKIATVFSTKMKAAFPEATFREELGDGDPDKEANFYVLKNTSMPAILTENFFMTNRAEAELLLSEAGRDRIAEAHFEGIKHIEKDGF